VATKSDRVELKAGEGGYVAAPDPRLVGPRVSLDGRVKAGERMSMKAKRLEIVSDGTLGGTSVVVDGVQVGGLVRLELLAQKGFPRVTAVAEMLYNHENIAEYAERAGKPVRLSEDPDAGAATVLVDIFVRK